jgi:hypothetical protein
VALQALDLVGDVLAQGIRDLDVVTGQVDLHDGLLDGA